MIPFIIGLLVGATAGMVIMSIVAAGKLADARTREIQDKEGADNDG